MSEYIINPMWFYWASVADGFKAFCIGLPIVIFGGSIFLFIIAYSELDDDDNKNKLIKTYLVIVALLVMIVIIGILIPSKETLIEMEIAKHATYENADVLVQKIKEVSDYIIENLK